ncbi:MAG: BON domain-containing protein [Chloroflexi bacterium]|nr:BON domain-containing protein [Chloroflexota bacterium]
MSGVYSTYCPTCGVPEPTSWMGPGVAYGPGYPAGFGPAFGYDFPPPGFWGGAYLQGMYGPGFGGAPWCPTDEQITQMIYDVIDADPAVPYDSDITVDATEGVVTLTGTVPNKRVKHAVGDDAWWVTGVGDIYNKIEVASQARRSGKAGEQRTS